MFLAPETGLWATQTAEYITIGGFILSIGTTVFAWGKWTQRTNSVKAEMDQALENHKEQVKIQLDGFGGRVGDMESDHDHINGRLEEASGHVQRILGQHDTILGLLGEARGSAVQCREDTQALGEKLEKKLENMTAQLSDTKLQLSERLKVVETKIDLLPKDGK